VPLELIFAKDPNDRGKIVVIDVIFGAPDAVVDGKNLYVINLKKDGLDFRDYVLEAGLKKSLDIRLDHIDGDNYWIEKR
jgi:hypothetical protein